MSSKSENKSSDVTKPAFRAGFVSLVGRPNVGKSSLLNALLGEKVAIVSYKPQTTRHRIHGILNTPEMQLVFVDTPGFCTGGNALMRVMRRVANQAVHESDVNVVLVEAPRVRKVPGAANAAASHVAIDPRDEEVLATVQRGQGKRVVVINKIDRVQDKRVLLPWIQAYMQRDPDVLAVIPVSALHGDGLDVLVAQLQALLPEAAPMFPTDLHTDQAERFLCAELIREQMLLRLHEEVPHSCMVEIEVFEDGRADADDADETDDASHDATASSDAICHIEGRIIVERESQKGIVVGKKGETIKEISTAARMEMEQLLGCRVFLRMQVVVRKDWTRNPRAVQEFGFGQQDDS